MMKERTQSVESLEPPPVIPSATPIKGGGDYTDVEEKLKQIEKALVHSERVELNFEKQL